MLGFLIESCRATSIKIPTPLAPSFAPKMGFVKSLVSWSAKGLESQ